MMSPRRAKLNLRTQSSDLQSIRAVSVEVGGLAVIQYQGTVAPRVEPKNSSLGKWAAECEVAQQLGHASGPWNHPK